MTHLRFQLKHLTRCLRNRVQANYVGPKIRKSVLEKLSKCFKASTERQLVSEGAEKESVDKARSIEILLGIGSALLAAAASIAAAVGTKGWLEGLSFASFRWTLLIAIGVSALTAVALVLFSRLRDRVTATKSDEFFAIPAKAREFENQIVERLRAIGVPFTQQRDVDLVISFKEKKIAVELKLFPPPATKMASIIAQMEKLLPKYGCDEGLIVIASSLPARIHGMSFGRIRLLAVDDLFKFLTAPEPLRGAS